MYFQAAVLYSEIESLYQDLKTKIRENHEQINS